MTIRDLIEQLESLADDHGDDIQVRLAIQPNWPFEHSIDAVGVAEGEDDEPDVVYIAEGSQLGYLSGDAARAIGWRD